MAARPDTSPDGKSTRPASSRDDLERYGVWVKAEPQDITPEPEGSSLLDSELGLPEESFLTEDEERLLGSFEDAEEGEEVSAPPKEVSDFDRDIFSSLPEIEDFEIPAMVEGSGSEAPSGKTEDAEFELSMEDLSAGFQEADITPSTPLDLSSVEGLEEPAAGASPGGSPVEEILELPDFDLPEEEAPEAAPRSAAGQGSPIEDVSAEFLDEAFGAASSSSLNDVTDEFLDGEESLKSPASAEAEPDFEPLDIELHFDEEGPQAAPVDHASAGFEELGELDGVLAAPPPAPEFDDLAALEKDLAGDSGEMSLPGASLPADRSGAAPAESGLANELLLKIANELSSIRSELVTLKSQLSAAKTGEPVFLGAEEEEPARAEAGGGFFDEEDDEKIALTGDELDNILSSADFTEEGVGEAFEAGETLSAAPEIVLEEEALLPEDGQYAPPPEEPVERISLEDEAPAAEEPLPPPEDSDIIHRIATEGIAPLTAAPEDTSYLEEPLEEEELLDISETPFVEAPLVEPDLSELSIDLGVDEELEVSGELPLMESEELADITLDLEAAEPPSAEDDLALPLEGEVLPEFEEENVFEDIELASEPEALRPPAEGEFADLEAESPLPFEDELHHEDKDSPLPGLGAEEELELGDSSLSLDEDLFVPEPEISPSSRPSEREAEFPGEIEPAEAEAPFEELLDEELVLPEEEPAPIAAPAARSAVEPADQTEKLKSDIRSVLSYLDRLLESLPEEKIEEFAHSEHFDTYKRLFEELGLV